MYTWIKYDDEYVVARHINEDSGLVNATIYKLDTVFDVTFSPHLNQKDLHFITQEAAEQYVEAVMDNYA